MPFQVKRGIAEDDVCAAQVIELQFLSKERNVF